MGAGSPQEWGWDIPKTRLALPLRQSQDPLGFPHQSQGHRELKVTVSPTRVASEAARASSLGDTVGTGLGRRRQSPTRVQSRSREARGHQRRCIFGGRIHPPSQLYNPRAPPRDGHGPGTAGKQY